MFPIRTPGRLVAVGVCCAGAGAGIGTVASAGASTSGSPSASPTPAHASRAHQHRRGGLRRIAHRAVSGQFSVHTRSGFQTVSFERGTVSAVNGDRLTLAVGTRRATEKSDTVTLGSAARVRDNGKRAQLSSVTAGQRVLVLQLPKRTAVFARTAKPAP